jgi:hypothetical protein
MEPPKNRLAGFGARGMASQQPLNVAAMPLPLDVRNDSAALQVRSMCNLHSIAKNQAAIRDLFKVARHHWQPATAACELSRSDGTGRPRNELTNNGLNRVLLGRVRMAFQRKNPVRIGVKAPYLRQVAEHVHDANNIELIEGRDRRRAKAGDISEGGKTHWARIVAMKWWQLPGRNDRQIFLFAH